MDLMIPTIMIAFLWARGFGERWIAWLIDICLRSFSSSVLVNESPGGVLFAREVSAKKTPSHHSCSSSLRMFYQTPLREQLKVAIHKN